MKKQLSDEQLDQMMRSLMSDALVDNSELDIIADSPSIWWGVQRDIRQKASPWPPPTRWWRVFFIGVPSMAALALVLVFVFLGGSADVMHDQARLVAGPEETVTNEVKAIVEQPIEDVVTGEKQPEVKTSAINTSFTSKTLNRSRLSSNERGSRARKGERSPVSNENKEAIKTDFIALSYADNPESGQIVRLKVPSSMMVTLGLVASVEKPSSLVDAEVLVGDDGLTHSIRFIRKGL